MEFVFEIESEFSFDKTIEEVKKALKEKKFGTLFELNFKDKFAEHELEYDKNFQVLEVCNPVYALKVLNISKHIGYFLPCKVVVYEEDDKVFVGMIKPSALIHMVTDDYDAYQLAHEVEDIIKSAMEFAK
jgi:uncharacterized protein (DUF302 family)